VKLDKYFSEIVALIMKFPDAPELFAGVGAESSIVGAVVSIIIVLFSVAKGMFLPSQKFSRKKL
jgi:hypothetical protein